MINDLDWSKAEHHMWNQHRVLQLWAMEACFDACSLKLDPDPASRSGQSMRIVGYSASAGAVIVVIVVRSHPRPVVATAWFANSSYVRRYREGIHDGET